MIVCSGNGNITLRAYEVLVPEKMSATTTAKPRKEETYKVIPEIIKVFHAAGRNYTLNIKKIPR
jgi:hypothetical protein